MAAHREYGKQKFPWHMVGGRTVESAPRPGSGAGAKPISKGDKLYQATCRHCGRPIIQHPSGVWTPRERTLPGNPTGIYCQQPTGGQGFQVRHEAMPSGLAGAPQWIGSGTARAAATPGEDPESVAPKDPPERSRDRRRSRHERAGASATGPDASPRRGGSKEDAAGRGPGAGRKTGRRQGERRSQ